MNYEPLETKYFNWLCVKVLKNGDDYRSLMEILFDTEFIWIVPADSHRAEDVLELRHEFLRANPRYSRIDRFYSVLEVFIMFAKRAAFQTDDTTRYWFWKFIENLGLDPYKEVFEQDVPVINDILYTFIWRIYEPDGEGGIFPMHQTQRDQRKIELWYQFFEYIEDHRLV